MEILICTNENYLLPAGVLLCSLFENNKEKEVNVHIFLGEGKADFWQPLCKLGQKYNQKIYLYQLSEEISSGKIDGIDVSRYPIEAYYRLFMAAFLPQDIHKVLYLDCDTIVCENLQSLWEENLDGYAIGAITDFQNDNKKIYERLGYDASYGYFNSGVLLVNLDYWRSNNVIPLFLDFICNNSEKLVFADQDVLNSLFFDKRKKLPIRYNLNTAFLFKKEYLLISSQYFPEIDDAYKRPSIIHFTTDRPWIKNSPNPLYRYWKKYRDITIWRGKSKGENKLTVVDRLVHILRCIKHGYWSFPKSFSYDTKYY